MGKSRSECAAESSVSTAGLPASVAESVSKKLLADCGPTESYGRAYAEPRHAEVYRNRNRPYANYSNYEQSAQAINGILDVPALDYGYRSAQSAATTDAGLPAGKPTSQAPGEVQRKESTEDENLFVSAFNGTLELLGLREHQ